MKISTRGRYAVRMLLDLAEHRESGYISLKEIAERQGVSKKYLEQIVILFNGTDFLKTNRGNHGGYMLARSPEEYTLAEILKLTEGSLAPVACLDNEPVQCERSKDCAALEVWKGLYDVVYAYLSGITLMNLLNDKSDSDII